MNLYPFVGAACTSLLALNLSACSGGFDSKTSPSDEAAGGDEGQGGERVSEPEVTAVVGAGSPGAQGGETSIEPVCIPQEEDLPDDGYLDSNCDGIDGDIAKAIFVAPPAEVSPLDEATGTMENPLPTIDAGIILARLSGADVYVCNGSYDAAVVMEGAGVNVYGGYDCAHGWKRSEERALVSVASGSPLQLVNVDGVVLDHLVFEAPNVTGYGESSISGKIVGSTGVHLTSVELRSGDGGPGANGTAGASSTKVGRTGATGGKVSGVESCNNCAGSGGKSQVVVSCAGGGVQGVGAYGGAGSDPDNVPTWQVGSDYFFTEGGQTAGASGGTGITGLTGSVGALSSHALGNLDGSLYVGVNSGQTGGFGSPGGAGGGGAGGNRMYSGVAYLPGGGGGQGGYSGCGGYPGAGGAGGGASISLLLVSSEVHLNAVQLVSGAGGPGGDGGLGGSGANGGAGGEGSQRGGAGGQGGAGGRGGAGAPGGGGPSIGLALSDSFLIDPRDVSVANGIPGAGGKPASQGGAAPGAAGVAFEAYDFDLDQSVEF